MHQIEKINEKKESGRIIPIFLLIIIFIIMKY
jgi:hypothetical protein